MHQRRFFRALGPSAAVVCYLEARPESGYIGKPYKQKLGGQGHHELPEDSMKAFFIGAGASCGTFQDSNTPVPVRKEIGIGHPVVRPYGTGEI